MSEYSVLEMLHKKEDESVFILLDGAVFPAMQRVYSYEMSPQVSPIYYGTRHGASLDASPCLYQPSGESEVWNCEEHWRTQGVVFVSACSYFEVLDYLKSLISVRLPNNQLAYWRFYSPEWLSKIMKALSDEDFSKFNGPVNQWAAYVDGRWELYDAVSHSSVETNKEEGWFQLSQNCIEKLKNAKKEEFYIRLEEKLASEISNVSFEGLCREDVLKTVAIAESLGFKSNYEIEWFTVTNYKYPGLMSRSDIKKSIENIEVAALERQLQVEEAIWGIKEERTD
ncbi:DUF4123 domain-containing protein [Halomonas sp. SH5A2]|uniref:DUF4123 domain-containing protein n=1 Tax=Halomonas sp. SH5A2 TaxID=2749040 RepID=UPI00163F1703|nr:DUF4123 domain-containing protein [Halomonas sp. SH5A2]QNI01818.1 DUF4123 domain-containing protein [Halomonas sp. SH5A2]